MSEFKIGEKKAQNQAWAAAERAAMIAEKTHPKQ